MNSDVRFYISVFMRRIHLFFIVAATIAGAAAAVAILLPTKYTSEALLLIESPQIPDELAASTVRTGAREQLEIMEQRLLTRANLIDIANENDVFADRGTMFADDIVSAMRGSTEFNSTTGRDRATLFRISFSAEDPQVAAAVVNSYVNTVLEDNLRLRTGRAEDTLEFFEQEVDRLGTDLERMSQRILDFKNANISALPESLEFRLGRQATLLERLGQIEREIAGIGQQRERLILVYNATGGAGNQTVDTRTDEERELDQLKNELASALTIYSEQNPRVRVLQARIASLETVVGSQASDVVSDATEEPAITVLDLQLDELDTRAENLESLRQDIVDELAELSVTIDATPGNAIALETLERDYANIQTQYNAAVSRLSAAQTGERIELLSKGERISVINQPVVPRTPASPNRPLIAFGGLAMGIGAGAGLIVLLELLNKSVRRPVDLTRGLGITPIATLPMIRTQGEAMRRRSLIVLLVLAIVVGIPLALYYVHISYLPLDLIFDRLVSRIGL